MAAGLGHTDVLFRGHLFVVAGIGVAQPSNLRRRPHMNWTKPEFKEVAVTLEVTAYAARR